MIVSGLDVHKDTIFCAVYNGKTYGEVKEYSTTTGSLRVMGSDLKASGVVKIAMESTSIYWIPVWNILEESGFELTLVNPYLIKQMPGRKSDVKDAQWIAKLLHKGMLRASMVPDERIRMLRSYSRKYVKLQRRITSVLQDIERTLEICNIRITSLVSNIGGKSILEVVRKIVSGENSSKVLLSCIHGRIKNRNGTKVEKALEGFISEHHRFNLELLMEEHDLLLSQSQRVESEMKNICKTHYSEQLDLLQSIPGIKILSAMLIIAETGADMKAFENSSKFVGWTGLRPRNDESAGKYKSTAITKGNGYLRRILVQVAWAASRTKGSYFKEKFNHLAVRKSSKKALIAIARKLSVIIWNVLKYKQEYNPGRMEIYDPVKIQAKLNYHKMQFERLEKIIQS